MNKIICLFCENTKNLRNSFISCSNFNLKKFYYYKCSNCKIVFVNPTPNSNDLIKIYGTNYYEKFYLKNIKKDKDYKFFYNNIKKFLNKNKSILDYGCGDGKFLKLFHKDNYKIYGADLNSPIIQKLKDDNLKVYNYDEISKINKKFDLIYLRDVFEHSTNPKLLLNTLYSLCKIDGYIILDGPIEKNLSLTNMFIDLNKHFKKLLNLNQDYNLPYHTILYSKNQLIKFFEQSNKFTKIEYKIYETGWPLKGNGGLKNLIAYISLLISKIPFINYIYGNRLIIVFNKNEK